MSRLLIFIFSLCVVYSQNGNDQIKLVQVDVKGHQVTSEKTIIFTAGLRQGQTITTADFPRAIKRLWQLGLFQDVQIHFNEETEEGLSITIAVEENFILGEIKYQGSKVDSYIASQCFLYLGENHFAYDQLSLGQNIDYWLSIHNVTFNKTIRDQSIRYLFGELNLNKKFYQLSFGQKKKLQLLLLMLVNKPIWILDDPFNGLDNDTIIKITTLLSKKLENKGIIIIASHQNLAIPHRTYDLT